MVHVRGWGPRQASDPALYIQELWRENTPVRKRWRVEQERDPAQHDWVPAREIGFL